LNNDPFNFNSLLHIENNKRLNRFIWSAVENCLGFRELSEIYQTYKDQKSPQEFIKQILNHLAITYTVKTSDENGEIPRTGSLLIVSNHPFGALEALILADHLSLNRSDVRILANVFLKKILPVSELLFGVNPFKDNTSIKNNQKVIRDIYHWLQNDHCLITFPAGNVSYLHLKKPFIADGEWDQQIARLARSTKSSVLPVFIEGRNSLGFYLLGSRLHALRYGLELLNKRNKEISLYQGKLITPEIINSIQSDTDLISYLRKQVL